MEIIPIGSTCSIAYQLKKLNLRNCSYPFDWIRINNLSNVTSLIENNFNNFLNKDNFRLDKISFEFEVNGRMISYIYDNNYCKFFHDFDDYIKEISFETFSEKYIRRINRLYNAIKFSKKILFIREEIGNLTQNKINLFCNLINKLNPNIEWKLRIIVRNEKFVNLKKKNVDIIFNKEKIIDWQRSDIDWKSIFIF